MNDNEISLPCVNCAANENTETNDYIVFIGYEKLKYGSIAAVWKCKKCDDKEYFLLHS